MKETLICKLNKHNIYYISTVNCGFYILIPFEEYKDTNITIRLKGNYHSYDLNKNNLDSVTSELVNYYKSIDNYNITLILPIFYDDILDRIKTVNDITLYHKLDSLLGEIFNNAYTFLTKNNIKVNNNIYVINNETFKDFTNWFVGRYNNRIEYRTILEMIKETDEFSSYDMIETPNINFVVGKNEEPKLEKTAEIPTETFDNISRNVVKEQKSNAGFVSYILLGIITFIVSIALLYLFVK